MFATMILVILTVILLTIFLGLERNTKKRPPGPFPWPVVGNQFLLKRLSREFGGQHKAFLELSKRYSSDVVSLILGSERVFIVSGLRPITTVLKSEEYDGRPWNEFIRVRNMGKKQGITMNDGTEWKDLRAWMVRTLRVFGFGKREMSEMIQDELLVILDGFKDGGAIQLKPLIAPAVINVIWCLVTGKPFSEGRSLKYFSDLMDRRAVIFNMIGSVLSTFPWIRYVAPEYSGYNMLLELNEKLKSFLMETIVEHRKNYKPGSESDLIDVFLQEMINSEGMNPIFTEDQLVLLMVDLFIAGSTTTSTTLDFVLLLMTVNQDMQSKLHEEIDSVIPRDRLPNLEDRLKLPYVEAVITETQRMYPVFPLLGPRRVLRDTSLEEYAVPKNTTILMNMYSVNQDETLYPEPQEFKPERHMKNGVFEPDPNSLQFGRGRRRCPGEALAKSALFLLFVGVMQKYTVLPVPGQGPYSVEVITGLTISPKPYKVLAVPR